MSDSISKSRGIKLPDWMVHENRIYKIPVRGNKTGFLRKTLTGISKVFQNEIFAERYVANGKLLQSVDPRVKLLTFLLFMILSGLAQGSLTLLFLAFTAFAFAKLSGLKIKEYMVRVWMVLPLLVFIFSIPAATNVFIQGKPLFYVYQSVHFKLGMVTIPETVYFTVEGFTSITKMALRVGVSFSFGYLLVTTSRWSHLTRSLEILRVPRVFISIFNMTYRYIFLLSVLAVQMMEARFLRTVGKIESRENRKFIAGRIAFLFIKSAYISEEIYDSMRCRCFSGQYDSLKTFKLCKVDFFWMMNCVMIMMIIFAGEILF